MHMNRPRPSLASILMVVCALAPPAFAGGPPASTTYSLTRPARNAGDMTAAIYRDGARETIKLSRANGWHSQLWFDFAAHKEWASDSNAPGQCSVIAYTSDGPPELLDPVPGAFAMASEVPADAPRSGSAVLGGVNTHVIKMPGGGTAWLDDTHHLAIKVEAVMESNSDPQTILDLTGIRFDKPDAALLAPPSGCKQLKGSANAHGGHAEVSAH
jgi:hypothetical protein